MALRRRPLLAGMLAVGRGSARAETRRYRVAFANLDETPGVTIEGLGFTGADVRRSFELAARTLPLDMLYFDNAGDPERAIANADAAIANTTPMPMRTPRLRAVLPRPAFPRSR
jgi:ribose transport system substrate-binding protein